MRFQTTTRWDLIDALKGACPDMTADKAMSELFQIYSPPLLAYAQSVNNGRMPSDECSDAVMSFFVRCLDKETLSKADKDIGKFRDFLLKSFKNHLSNFLRDRRTLGRQPKEGTPISLDALLLDGSYLVPRSHETPEDVYQRIFRASILTTALEVLRARCTETKYSLFCARQIEPLLKGAPPPGYAELAAQYGIGGDAPVNSTTKIVKHAEKELRSILSDIVSRHLQTKELEEIERECDLVLASAAHESVVSSSTLMAGRQPSAGA
jgi:hypothetical protein